MPPLTLPLGELESLACTLLAVFLSFMAARIARKKSELFQPASQFGVEFNQRPGKTKFCCICLTAEAAAVGENQHVELFSRLCCEQRLPDSSTRTLRCEIFVHGPAVDSDAAFAGPQEHTGYGLFSTAGTEVLNQSCH